jgi:hypothetical protein
MPHLIARNVNDLSGGALVGGAATLPRLAVLRLLRVAVLPLYRRSVGATGWLRLNHLNQLVSICISICTVYERCKGSLLLQGYWSAYVGKRIQVDT